MSPALYADEEGRATMTRASSGTGRLEEEEEEEGTGVLGDEWTRRVEPGAGNWLLGIPPTTYPTASALTTLRPRKITKRCSNSNQIGSGKRLPTVIFVIRIPFAKFSWVNHFLDLPDTKRSKPIHSCQRIPLTQSKKKESLDNDDDDDDDSKGMNL
ncbi:hypothetical protein M0802_002840 [Mischocyttarus mexicanus]|nr:hypothetical protein M0802_002840 [Mischocyttarus mexicanus]